MPTPPAKLIVAARPTSAVSHTPVTSGVNRRQPLHRRARNVATPATRKPTAESTVATPKVAPTTPAARLSRRWSEAVDRRRRDPAGAGRLVADPDRARDLPGGVNPFAVPVLPTNALLAVGMTLFLGALVASVVALLLRFRRSGGVERQQLKWFVFAAAVAGIALPTTFALWYVVPGVDLLAAIALIGLPVAATVAILRYHLYDVDVVINRTFVYAALSVTLVTAYGVTAVLLGALLGGGSPWTIAAATLVVALAFHPVRAWIQGRVDKRFNRARYHALRRMADFLEDLRAGRALAGAG